MATSEITADGKVVPPLNITNPTPFLSLSGFQWHPLDEMNHGPPASQDDHHEEPSTEQAFTAADVKPPTFQRAAAAPPALAVQAPQLPQLPLDAPQLPVQLTDQLLGLDAAGRPPPVPAFPLEQFRGSYAGNGFNMIFRPLSNQGKSGVNANDGPDDNILEVNLTTEQWTFGPTLGKIPNRGFGNQPDITLGGLPYLQTVKDVTNEDTGEGDKSNPKGIHFEPGVWLTVPGAKFQKGDSVVRMASIPHGTTINAQGLAPTKVTSTALGGEAKGPSIPDINTTPFFLAPPHKKQEFKSMDATKPNTLRLPQNLQPFVDRETITTDIIKNPNIVLRNAIKGQTIKETISFEVTTGPPVPPGLPLADLNGGGIANISFLAGDQKPVTTVAPGANDNPNAHADFMTSRFWIETVEYDVNVPKLDEGDTVLLRPTMPPFDAAKKRESRAPTPVFAITAPRGGVPAKTTIKVPGIQIQYSQTVNLNFGPRNFILTWPHVSVATLVPTGPQPFQMK